MKNVLSKLRVNGYIFKLRLRIFWSEIIAPFEIIVARIKRYLLLRKIDKESQDNWEKHVKIKEIENQDEFNLRRQQFFCLKAEFIGAFIRAGLLTSRYVVSQDNSHEVDNELLSNLDEYQEMFKKEKQTLIELMKKFNEYDEITFDEGIKTEILTWEFESCKTTEEIKNRQEKFTNYMQTLDLVQ